MMSITLTALLIVLPILGCIPSHMAHAAIAAPVDYDHYDYR